MSISGNLRTMPFPDLLQWVSQSRKTGTLAVEGNPYTKKIYFRKGLIVAASSENPKEFLGYYLVGWNYISEEELQELLDMQDRHGTLLGELLVIIGHLGREELAHILKIKTEETIYELFLWEEGDFRFLENILPAKKFQPVNLAVESIVLEGVRRQDEWIRCRERIPDVTWIPRLVRAVDVQSIGRAELAILREINGRASIEQIALSCRLALFHVLLFVYYGVEQDLFELRPPSEQHTPIPGFSSSSWRTLVRQVETMVERGDLGDAQGRLADIRRKYGGHREAAEKASILERKIRDAADRIELADAAVLELAVSPTELTALECSPQEGFLLSRINGSYTVGQILKVIPSSALEAKVMIDKLIRGGVVRVKDSGAGEKADAEGRRVG